MAKIKFIGMFDDKEHEIIVDDHDLEDGMFTVSLDGNIYEIDAVTMPSEIVSALINDKSYDLEIDDKDQSKDLLDGRITVRAKGRVFRFEMLSSRRKKMKDASASVFAAKGEAAILAPMPGKILRFVVSKGDEVKKGQGLVVIEAMKMENELKSPKDGVIKSIEQKQGSAVESGTCLLIVE